MKYGYELGRVIGRGGNGTVYEAVDERNRESIALKVLQAGSDAIAVERLKREARTARSINHPNVCRTLDFGKLVDGRSFIAMERLHGETLRALLRRERWLEPDDVIEFGAQILSALEAAHTHGVVHRDVKPENVFVVDRDVMGVKLEHPRLKLLDFGICKHIDDPLDGRTLTMVGAVVGTPRYLAPESAYGDWTADPRMDLFALGLILYEALAGSPAYRGANTAELAAGFSCSIPSLESLHSAPPALSAVVARAIDKNSANRYRSAGEFQHELLEARTAMRYVQRVTAHRAA